MLEMMGVTRRPLAQPCSSLSISKMLFSSLSRRMSSFGQYVHNCRQSSQPIDPPAPVTRMRFPR